MSVELGHFNAGQLADYFSGLWTPDQQREIEVHLSRCDACATSARQVYVDMFVIDNWTAKAKKAKAATRSAAAR